MTQINIQQYFLSMRLSGMASAYNELLESTNRGELSFDDKLQYLLERESLIRDNRVLERRLKNAKLKYNTALEEISFGPTKGIGRETLLDLSHCKWIDKKQNIIITGATGVGKTYLACGLGHKACREGYNVLYIRLPRFLEQCLISRSDNEYIKTITKIGKIDVLILDDWGIGSMNEMQRKDILELIEERYQRASTIIVAQLPVKNWHEIIGEQIVADAILDRVVHNAHRLQINGGSMRKKLD
jgi:DNA replication protein DnaC